MKVDDDSKEPVTELSLSLDYFNQGTTHLIENSGAGANATSRVDMAFVASDHLTELVWLPRKGLSVKCTNCSTAAEESRRMLAVGMGNKPSSANQADKVKELTAVTSSKSSGRNDRIGIACQSANTPVNEGSRCQSSPCLKNVSELPGTPLKSMLTVSSRKRSFHTIYRAKKLCLHEKTEQPQLCLTSNIVEENQQSSSIPEENQKSITVKKQKLNVDEDISVFKSNSFQGEDFPTDSKINEYQRKGKAKVLSDANVGHVQEESRGSIESCSSAGSFCSQQRKRTLQEVFTNETKRIKTTVQQSSHPMPLVNGSSSFLSWISNTTKGINKANQNGAPCLALTLPPSGPQSEKCELKLLPHPDGTIDENPRQRTGFQNIFQSTYCKSSKVHKRPAISDEHQVNVEALDACTRDSLVDVFPLSMREMTSSSCKGDQSSGNGERQLNMQRIGDNRELYSTEKVASCNLLTKAHSFKFDKCGTHNMHLSPHAEVNAGLTTVSDPLQSFWITRFYPKSPVPLSVSVNRGQALLIDKQTNFSKNVVFRSSDVSKFVLSKGELLQDLNELTGGKSDGATSGADPSVGLKEEANFDSQTFDCNIHQTSVTERLKSSEVMTSMFARRLDAIKHMTPADMTGNASGVGTTCFYCGKKGHSLHNCSEFTENKLEGVLDSIKFPDHVEKTPYLCIRCFQLGHWASDCATTQVTVCEPLAIPNIEFLEMPGARGNKELLVEKKDMPMAGIPPTLCIQNSPKPDPKLHKLYSESGHVKLELEESAAAPLPNLIGRQSSDNLRGYFDAVRLLRLSRREILKLMDSQAELSNLDGFFLRVRLGNMEKGHAGTGYHVAYIDGVQSEHLSRGSKFILPVNMGSVKTLVGSPSISNQNFLEDELMAWWSATVENGNKLPTQEELNDKLLHRNKLRL